MLISMTGFGQGEASDKNTTVSVEIRTVNHRFLDYSLKLPRVLNPREREIKKRIRQKINRGRIYITVSVEGESANREVKINTAVMTRYLALLREFADKHKLEGGVDLNTLAQLPEVFETGESANDDESLWPLVEKGVGLAIDACHQMRVNEGKALEKDLRERIAELENTVGQIEKIAPDISRKHAEQFRRRVEKLLGNATVDNDRLATEIALMADRLDITEELTRLRSHMGQLNETITAGGEVSKKLTYLLQEVHREASTIGAKASDSEVIQHVVALKEVTEKLREQVQNIE